MVTRENHKLCRQSDRKTVPFQLVAVSTVGEKGMCHSQMPMPCKLSLQPANCQFQLVADIAGGAQRNKNNDNNILFDLAAVGSTSASVGVGTRVLHEVVDAVCSALRLLVLIQKLLLELWLALQLSCRWPFLPTMPSVTSASELGKL